MRELRAQIRAAHILAIGLTTGKILGVLVVAAIAFRLVRRVSYALEAYVQKTMLQVAEADAPAPNEESSLFSSDHRVNYQATIRRWFHLLERFAEAAIVLGVVWFGGHIAGFPRVSSFAAIVLRIVTIVTLARLLTLSCRTISYGLAYLGNRHLGHGKFQRYWERVTRLIPFGERCFDAAVYITAASMCVRELDFIAFVATYGTNIVKCIGIFFSTRLVALGKA